MVNSFDLEDHPVPGINGVEVALLLTHAFCSAGQ